MNRIFSATLICGALLLSSCGSENTATTSPRTMALEKIKQQEALMHRSQTLDKAIADSAVASYTAFVNRFPNDTLSADFTFKMAEIQTATGDYQGALNSYKFIKSKYPKFGLVVESLFLQAVLLDNYLDKDGEARTVYEELIQKYPNSPFADQARAAIANLGKTDQELIEEFKKKNAAKK